MKTFPYEFEARKEIQFYPNRPDDFSAHSLEIGPGRGDFLLSVAGKYPDRKFATIELGKRRYYKMIPRIEKKGLSNIILINGNARIVINEYFDNALFDKIYILFPDPWPKKRHIPHRLMSIEFLRLIMGLLKPGGHLYSATDYWPYAIWAADNLKQIGRLRSEGKPLFTDIDAIDDYSPSFFENKWRDEGRAIYYMKYLRK
ncbi:MAG: hypothetical protein V3V99_05955 [candidate division Zixibacteria bacterium]